MIFWKRKEAPKKTQYRLLEVGDRGAIEATLGEGIVEEWGP